MQSCTQRHCTELFQGNCAALLCLLAILLPHTHSSQIFPIWESSIQRLRVKLVGLKRAGKGREANYQNDVRDLGAAMCWIATVRDNSRPDDRDFAAQLQSLKSYDPSLFFLITWMTNTPPNEHPPTMQEVLRHPYFMSPAQRQTFGIAIGGGMIGAYLCKLPHENKIWERSDVLCRAVGPELEKHFNHQLGLMFDTTTSSLSGGGGGGGGNSSSGGIVGAAAGAAAATGLGGGAAAAHYAKSSDRVPLLDFDRERERKYCDQVELFLGTLPDNVIKMDSLGDHLRNPYGGKRERHEAKRQGILFRTTAAVLESDEQQRFVLFEVGPVNFVRLAATATYNADHDDWGEWFDDFDDHEDRNHHHNRNHFGHDYRQEERQKERNRLLDRRC
jgi:hypothetical protein